MAYVATPAAQPAPPAEAAYEGKAPPTIDSHGGKLTPISCFCAGPDGPTVLLMWLALLLALAPRGLKLFGRQVEFRAIRLAPGLLLTTLLIWNQLPSLDPAPELPARFNLVAPLTAVLGGALLAVSFLRLLSDALMPLGERSRARSGTATMASGLAALMLTVVAGLDVFSLLNTGELTANQGPVIGGLLGFPAGVAVLLAWRRFNGRLFDVLLVIGTVGLLFLGEAILPGPVTDVFVFLTVTLTVAAGLGAGLRGMGWPRWQALTGRMAWVLSWVTLIIYVIAIGSWTIL